MFNNQVSETSGAVHRKPSKTLRSIGFANAVFADFEWLAKPWGRVSPTPGFCEPLKISKTAFAKPILREVFDGFLYSAPDVPKTWLLNTPHRTVTYSTIQYETVH